MKVSLNIVKRFTNVEPVLDDLVVRINQQLGGVEEVIDIGIRYQGVTIVKVVECSPIEGTDHLNATKIDDGGVNEGIERDENGLIQVVCGAPNVHADMLAAWIPPGYTVPATFEDAEPFVLGTRELRGVMSNGMLASPKELGFGESHEGILEIDPNEWNPSNVEVKPGANFAETYGLNDYIIDIENKMFTHRPDCFGQLGVAREIAGILHQSFASPDWYKNVPEFAVGEGLTLNVQNDIADKVPRFMAVAIKDVIVKPSPVWLQAELVRLGSKPINNIVDVTNYVMLLTAQPLHAYDYDKVATGKLGVRLANDGEKLRLLGGKEIELNNADIVITDGEKPIGLGGVMGGADTEVSGETKNIILECANFDMYTVRRTSMRHGLFTDAVTRFTKGQSPLQNPHVLNLALTSIFDVTDGKQASGVIDTNATIEMPDPVVESIHFINDRLGLKLSQAEMTELLTNVEMSVSDEDGSSHPNPGEKDYPLLLVHPPFWRTDLELSEDIVEEVGRLYGFDKLPQELPQRTLKPAFVNPSRELKRRLCDILSRAGANEVLTYSFVHRNLLERAGQNADDTYQLSNALSPDLHYFRRTVLPSLLDKIHPNVKAGYDQFALFEIGKGHKKSAGTDDQGVPLEQQFIALALAGGDFYHAKAFVEFIAKELNVIFNYVPVEQGKLFEPKRSALIVVGEDVIGAVGEYRSVIKKNFKLPDLSSGFEIDFDKLLKLANQSSQIYRPLSRFPSAERDITFKVAANVSYAQVNQAAEEGLKSANLDTVVTPLDIYQPAEGGTKNVTLRIRLTSQEKTLSGDEVSGVMETLAGYVISALGATVI